MREGNKDLIAKLCEFPWLLVFSEPLDPIYSLVFFTLVVGVTLH